MIDNDVCLIAVSSVSTETGMLLPVGEIGKIARKHDVLFHTDAVQAVGKISINVAEMGVDFLSFSGHKFHAPKGVGALYVNSKTMITPLIIGGHQERGKRAGTENVPYIVGMAKAAQLAMAQMPARAEKERMLRDHLIGRVSALLPQVHLNGSYERRLPGNASLTFPGLSSETALIRLDMEGICASAGSACSTGALEPSRVLTAIGLSAQEASCTLRFSVSAQNTIEEIDHTASILIDMYQKFQHD